MIKIIFALLCSIQCVNLCIAQTALKPADHLLNSKWAAKWIAPPNVSLTNYGVFHFRKNFELTSKPSSFVINISADNRYRLFVNGSATCIGPARGDLAHWRYETVDIARYLQIGKNVIAVQVWNFAENRAWAQISHQTGLIVQGNDDGTSVVNTDSTWRVVENVAYTPLATIAHITGPGDQVFSQRYPWGWEKPSYDDRDWKNAIVSEDALPSSSGAATKRILVPRNIPFVEEKLQRFSGIRKFEGLAQQDNFIKGTGSLEVHPWANVTILIDQSFLTTAYPQLLVSGGAGAKITITYAEALVTNSTRVKGNRNEVENKDFEQNSDRDIFLPDGGAARMFRPLWYRTFRYVQLKIENHQEHLTIHDFNSMFSGYPFQENAYFKSDDQSLKNVWDVGWRTARLCAYETYMDCPYYEQLQYVGDTRIQALVSLYVSGDDRLMRNSIQQFHNSIFEEGLTKSRYPDYRGQVIPPFSLFWIGMLHDFWMHRDDAAFVKSFLPEVSKVLAWHEKHIDPTTNMLGKLPHWNFVDWPTEWPWKGTDEVSGVPEGALEGNSAILTLQYVDALKNASEIFSAFNMQSESVRLKNLAAELTEATETLCWDKNRKLLADSPAKKDFSQHANTWAVLTDIVKPDDQKNFMNKVEQDTSLIQCTLYYRFYLNKAIKEAGLGNRYVELLQPWRNMISLGLTTFAERPEPTRSDCHAWSSSPNYDLLATVCGIQPSSPGFKTVRIEPAFGNLKWIEGSVPHPLGNITLKLRRSNNGVEGEVSLPKGLTGEFVWNKKRVVLKEGTKKITL